MYLMPNTSDKDYMEKYDYRNYDIADISEEDIKNISELEKSLSTNAKEDVILIAYKRKEAGKKNNRFF